MKINKKLIVKNTSGAELQFVVFEDQMVMDDFIGLLAKNKPFGAPEHQRELTPMIHNEDGTITEATYETVPSEYTVEIVDITAEVEAERVKKETKHNDRASRVTALKAIDWATVDTIAELKVIVRHLVKESIKDDE